MNSIFKNKTFSLLIFIGINLYSNIDFAQEKKAKGIESLSRFEAVVFSGISTDANNIPGTFDGVEQLAADAAVASLVA